MVAIFYYFIYNITNKGLIMIGFLNVYKPTNVTSNYVVQKIKKQFNIKKVGHMGTLDPLARGLLPIAIGKATRLFDYMLEKVKRYNVTYEFGYETDTLDSTGQVILQIDKIPSIAEIKDTIALMIGKQNQIPPKFSAKNIDGKRAYDLARLGIDFELKPKQIEIFEIEFISKSDKSYSFSILCSSGTYIRAIGRDMAYKLGTYATMISLERAETGCFKLDNSIQLDKLLNYQNIEDVIISPLEVFKNYDQLTINDKQYKDLIDGKAIGCEFLHNNVFLIYNNKLIGITKAGKDYLKLDTYLEE